MGVHRDSGQIKKVAFLHTKSKAGRRMTVVMIFSDHNYRQITFQFRVPMLVVVAVGSDVYDDDGAASIGAGNWKSL